MAKTITIQIDNQELKMIEAGLAHYFDFLGKQIKSRKDKKTKNELEKSQNAIKKLHNFIEKSRLSLYL